MHLVIVSAFKYPNGGPAATRHLALAAGLADRGHQVTFLLLNQSEVPSAEPRPKSVHWVSVASNRSGSALSWRLAAILRLRGALKAASARGEIDAVLLVDRDPLLMEAGLRSARKQGALALHEMTEFPDVVAGSSRLASIAQLTFSRRHIHRLGGVLVISRALEAYVAERSKVPVLRLGPIVDLAANRPLPEIVLDRELVVGYSGSLLQRKDGVLTLLRAVSRASRMSEEVRFRVEIVGGDMSSPEGRQLTSEAEALGIADRTVFHGQVSHSEVRGLLATCHLLILPRPISRQARGGFPTKLGEYLSTGRPVLTTAVGDIPRYLRGGRDCLMTPPNDERALASAIIEVSNDYGRVRELGREGRNVVVSQFNARVQSAEFVGFVRSLRGGTHE